MHSLGDVKSLDVGLIANELIGLRIKSGNPGVVCKLDIDKTYGLC